MMGLLRWAWATLAANVAIVVTGGVVRLTGSGLGCDTWPKCSDESYTPHTALSWHSFVEFGNRTLTFVLVLIAAATLVSAWRHARRTGITLPRRLAWVILLGIPAQAVLGGITVLTDLNPWVVSGHLVASAAIIVLSVWLLLAVRHPGPTPRPSWLGWAVFGVGWVAVYLGTVVTGAGPHAGDADAVRNGLDIEAVARLHALSVWALVALTVIALVRAPGREVWTLFAVELAQGGVGYAQYFLHVPAVLVGLHMFGAALTVAAMTWVLLRRSGRAAGPGPA